MREDLQRSGFIPAWKGTDLYRMFGLIKMKVAIYVRVSTEGQTYDQQIDACKNFCKIKEWNDYTIFKEIESSAKVRLVFDRMIAKAKEGEFKYIVVFRLDRAWRSSRQFIMDFDALQRRGIYPISIMEGLDPTTPIGKAFMTILVALAELERENISLATKQRLGALRNLGVKLGRPKGSQDKKKRKNIGYIIREAKKRGDNKTIERLEGIRSNK